MKAIERTPISLFVATTIHNFLPKEKKSASSGNHAPLIFNEQCNTFSPIP
jgi:hypothetical protein